MKKILVLLTLMISGMSYGKDIILLQGAMDIETNTFIAKLENKKIEKIDGFLFWTGKISNKNVVVSKTEIGMVNASIATMIAIEHFHPTVIINQGTSGGHDPKLHRYDIVLGERTLNMGTLKSKRREVGEGTKPNEWVAILDPTTIPKDGKMKEYKYFNGDKTLLKLAESIKYTNGKLVKGVIGTADQWNRELDRIAYLHETYGTSTEEMETSAAAQVAEIYGIPFLGIRVLSNIEIHNETFSPKSAVFCQEFVLKLVKKL